jgi:hypothetical protein
VGRIVTLEEGRRGKSLEGALESSVRERLHIKQSMNNVLNSFVRKNPHG